MRMPVIFLLTAMLLTSCEQFFTTSVLDSFKRDMSTMPIEFQVQQASNIAQSGDSVAIQQMLDSLSTAAASDPTNVELNEAVVELAVASTGIEDTLSDLSGLVTSNPTQAEIDAAIEGVLASVDTSNAVTGMQAIENLEAQGEIPSVETYVMVAAALVLDVVESDPAIDVATVTMADLPLATQNFITDAQTQVGASVLDDLVGML